MSTLTRRGLGLVASPASDRIGLHAMGIAIAIVFRWISGLKFVPCDADSARAVLGHLTGPAAILARIAPAGAPVRS